MGAIHRRRRDRTVPGVVDAAPVRSLTGMISRSSLVWYLTATPELLTAAGHRGYRADDFAVGRYPKPQNGSMN